MIKKTRGKSADKAPPEKTGKFSSRSGGDTSPKSAGKSTIKASRKAPQGQGQRQLRVAEQIRHLLVEVLRRGSFLDPALFESHLITVTAVDIGPDLKNAIVYVMPLGGKNADVFLPALNRASGYFRNELAKGMDLRHSPTIAFKLDQSFDIAGQIETILRQERVQKDLLKAPDEEADNTL